MFMVRNKLSLTKRDKTWDTMEVTFTCDLDVGAAKQRLSNDGILMEGLAPALPGHGIDMDAFSSAQQTIFDAQATTPTPKGTPKGKGKGQTPLVKQLTMEDPVKLKIAIMLKEASAARNYGVSLKPFDVSTEMAKKMTGHSNFLTQKYELLRKMLMDGKATDAEFEEELKSVESGFGWYRNNNGVAREQ